MAAQLLFPAQALTFSYNDLFGCFLSSVMPPPFTITPGQRYRVIWGNEGAFEVTAVDAGAIMPGVIVMGNGAPYGFPGNNEPFIVAVAETDVTFISITDTKPETRPICVYHLTEDAQLPQQPETPQVDGEYLIQGSTLQSIAQAIRNQLGISDAIAAADMAARISEIPVGGGNSADVRYVTFFSQDGSVVYGTKAVAVGDDCADPIARGLFPAPTKESTPQYRYTFAGWSTTPNGALDPHALSAVTEDRVVYANFAAAAVYYTIQFYDGDTLLQSQSLPYGATITYTPAKSGFTFTGWLPEAVPVVANAVYHAQWKDRVTFANGSWQQIAEISQNGLASEYFAVGDTKTLQWGNYSYNLVILGFDHDDLADGSGKAGMTVGVLTSTPNKIAPLTSQQSLYACWGNSTYCNLYKVITGYQSDAALAEIRAVAKPVFKYSFREIDNKNQKTTDTFFALSSTEVGGSAITTGSKYAYFTNASKRMIRNAATGNYEGYYLRDAAITNSYKYWYYVDQSGNVGSHAPASTANYYPVFAFCL